MTAGQRQLLMRTGTTAVLIGIASVVIARAIDQPGIGLAGIAVGLIGMALMHVSCTP